MYTLFVTGAAAEQDHGIFQIEAGRFLEWTDELIVTQLRPLSIEAMACLESWPCVLMDEGRTDQPVRIGRVTGVSTSRRDVSLTFAPLPLRFGITNDDLWKLKNTLDIGDFEFSRNHIAVKDRPLFRALTLAGYDFGDEISSSFVELPLPAPPRAELLQARNAISEWGHTEINDLLLEIGSPELDALSSAGSRRDRANAIVRFALEHPEAKTAENSLLTAYLVRRAGGNVNAPANLESGTSEPTAGTASPPTAIDSRPASIARSPNRVFIVHGNNDTARTAVVEYLRELGLDPIVLHDQPNMGRHLLTKFIQEAELVTFAVVLMTDDDVGSRRDEELRPRARQNVILELGYFLAHLGQPSVCALVSPGLETPSDFDGIVYIRMDAGGGWRRELARELIAANMPVATTAR